MYLARTGCQWRYLPKDFPPFQTVYWYFTWWHDDGTVERVHDALRVKVRQADGRCAEPSADLVDSQSVRAADTALKSTSGFDAGKKTKGRKRFIVTDTLGLLLTVHVLAPDRREDLGRSGLCRPTRRVALRRPAPQAGRSSARSPDSTASRPSRSWAVERTFARITTRRRLACDYERNPAHCDTMIRWAMTDLILRLLRGRPTTRQGPRPLRKISDTFSDSCMDPAHGS